MIDRSEANLHPEFRPVLVKLLEQLAREHQAGRTKTLFKLYEGYRSPERQLHLVTKTKSTKAGPWQSAHNYGLAADIVPWAYDRWSWSEHHDYTFLKRLAGEHGLSAPIAWDKCHIEHPLFRKIMRLW